MKSPAARGFTLIELTVTLALIVLVMGVTIVRFGWGGARQQTIQEARTLANVIGTYRERAIAEEALYALELDAEAGRYELFKLTERRLDETSRPIPLRSHTVSGPISVRLPGTTADAPDRLVLYFDARGILAPARIELAHPEGPRVALRIEPLDTEVQLDEP
ncbi:MAG: type II secretion system protein [Planctomycetes bacterium]|nr:type II secretion system protein [Planctomycetota bacterium]